MTAAPDIATDLRREMEQQRRWKLRPRYTDAPVFDRLVRNEFSSADERQFQQGRALVRIVRFAATQVPYYRDLFAARGIDRDVVRTPADLAKLPLLDKVTVRQKEKHLQPASLPRGETVFGVFTTSGTTGQPTRVAHSAASNLMFTYLTQRSYRWHRFNPAKSMAVLRTSFDLPRKRDGTTYGAGEAYCQARWRYAATFFETGPWHGLASNTPVEQQLKWLQIVQPAYLAAAPSWLEYLTYASKGQSPVDSLEGVIAVTEQITADMRERLERVFRVPVNQNYGLNEIGLVAVRCPAGRYHVHGEHCLVEIVDSAGQPCAPGVPGRIVVTGLSNLAMPLLRYDTDDQAEWPADPCPCGRTLPAFVNLFGRYRRYIALPEGAYDLYRGVRACILEMPDDLMRPFRQFQLHLYRDGRYELRLATSGPMPAAFRDRIEAAWAAATSSSGKTLRIIEVDKIPSGPNGKFQDFTSDNLPTPTREPSNPD